MIQKISSISLSILYAGTVCLSQTSQDRASSNIQPLEIGDKVPEVVYQKLPVKAGTKLIILDFWATTCAPCIAAFPKMKSLQDEFKGDLQVILVNKDETKEYVDKRLAHLNESRRDEKKIRIPDLASVYKDTIFSQLFPFTSIPHHVWINNEREVIAITEGYSATSGYVSKALTEHKLSVNEKKMIAGYDKQSSLLRTTNPAIPIPSFYSAFFPFVNGLGGGIIKSYDSTMGLCRITFKNFTVPRLFDVAFNLPARRLLVEVKKKNEYIYPKDPSIIDEWKKENCFSYEMVLPMQYEKDIYAFMQSDLNRFFGMQKGVQGNLEQRTLPFLILKLKSPECLSSKGGKRIIDYAGQNVDIQNNSYLVLSRVLSEKLENIDAPILFADETGIDNNLLVDIKLTGVTANNLDDLNRQLSTYGLMLVKESRKVEILVIKDKYTGPAAF